MGLICDKEGVPNLIQDLQYNYGNASFYALLFTGKWFQFVYEEVAPSISSMQECPNRMQMLEAENNITKEVLSNFKNKYAIKPDLYVVGGTKVLGKEKIRK